MDTETVTGVSKAVVVGVMLRQMPVRLREHPRVEVWDADRAPGRELPLDTGVVILGRHVSHKVAIPLTTEARKRHVPVQGPMAPGRVKQAVAVFLGEGDDETPARAAYGAVAALVRAEANLEAPTAAETDRLWGLARDRGLVTTTHSIAQTFRAWRRNQRAAAATALVRPAPVATPTDFAATSGSTAEAVRVLEDGTASLQLVREELMRLVGDNVRLTHDNQALAAENKRLRERIEMLAAIFQDSAA